MDSRAYGPARLALGLAARAALATTLIVLLVLDLATTTHYATALVLALLTGFVLLEASRRYAAAAMPAVAQADRQAQAPQIDRMQALLDAVSVALIVLGPDGRIALVNRAARLLAAGEAAWLTDIPALGPQAAAAIATLPVGARQIMAMADGRPMLVWVASFAAPGQPRQNLISLQAVTGELDAVQLKAWMDMSRVLSHEIMNSLTPIASLSESLGRMLQPGATPETADALAAIGRRSQHLMSFVERYRRIADLPAPALSRIMAADFVADIDALIQPALAARGIGYRSAAPPSGLGFQADVALLSQALINLLHNAGDAASAAPSPSVAFSCTADTGSVVFTVTDNGPGIAPERRQEIFLPFFTTKPEGSGIGLSLARQIVLAHGGRIWLAEAQAGETTFLVALPTLHTA